jgi:aspartate carbamoyltransferase catalytic subunit
METACTCDVLKGAKEDLIIMYPLPRGNKIYAEVDETPHARYFQQVWNDIVVRIALLPIILGATE